MCYDQMLQTQKRKLIKQVLDCSIGRMLEYKRQIANMHYMEYQYARISLSLLRLMISNLRRNIVCAAVGAAIF